MCIYIWNKNYTNRIVNLKLQFMYNRPTQEEQPNSSSGTVSWERIY